MLRKLKLWRQYDPIRQTRQNHRVSKQVTKSAEWAKVRRPLSKSEREQLAADLRLLSGKDEDTLNLLGDRINQEF